MWLLSYFIIYQYLFGVVVITVTAVLLRPVHSNGSTKVSRKFHRVEKMVDIVKNVFVNKAHCQNTCLLTKHLFEIVKHITTGIVPTNQKLIQKSHENQCVRPVTNLFILVSCFCSSNW